MIDLIKDNIIFTGSTVLEALKRIETVKNNIRT